MQCECRISDRASMSRVQYSMMFVGGSGAEWTSGACYDVIGTFYEALRVVKVMACKVGKLCSNPVGTYE